MNERKNCNFKLNLGDRTMEASVAVPVAPLRPVDMLPLFLAFSEAISGAAAERSEAEGKPVSCRAGCAACCRQAVPISETEARYIAAMVAEMPADRRAHVKRRFEEAIAALDKAGLLPSLRDANSLKTQEERRDLGLRYFAAGVPCPFLEDENCSIHEHRPISCREYLVTSPAANCAAPSGDTVDMVQLSVKPSVVMYRFGDGKGEDEIRHVPLVLALEWAEAHQDDSQPLRPGPDMLDSFLYQIRARVR